MTSTYATVIVIGIINNIDMLTLSGEDSVDLDSSDVSRNDNHETSNHD